MTSLIFNIAVAIFVAALLLLLVFAVIWLLSKNRRTDLAGTAQSRAKAAATEDLSLQQAPAKPKKRELNRTQPLYAGMQGAQQTPASVTDNTAGAVSLHTVEEVLLVHTNKTIPL